MTYNRFYVIPYVARKDVIVTKKIIYPCDRDLLVFTKWHNKQDYLIYQMLQCTRFMICTSAFASPIFFVISHVLHNLLISYLAIHFSFEILDLIAKTGYCQNVSFFFGYAAMRWHYYRHEIPIFTMIVYTRYEYRFMDI